MDHGQDAALACMYHREHEHASTLVSGQEPSGIIAALRSVSLLKRPLEELLNEGYTPTTLVSSGAPWSKLCKRYGATALLSNGFTWAHARTAGISAEQACALGMDAFHISANELMELCPSISNVASLQLPLDRLKSAGFGMKELVALGLNSANMREFGASLASTCLEHCSTLTLGFGILVFGCPT